MSLRRKVIFSIVVFLIVLAVIEGTLHLIDAVRGGAPDPRRQFSSFEGKEWAQELNEDFDAFSASNFGQYEPFVVWGTKDFHSRYVNVEHGLRKTWNPEFSSGTQPREVYVFGGSTVFGAGARDEHTLPSYVSRLLNSEGAPYRVTNYGQPGYIITQNILQLIFLLRDGGRPDYVILWNGGNDTTASYEAVKAGALVTEELIRSQLEGSPFQRIWVALKSFASAYCKTCRAVALFARRFDLAALRAYDIKGIHASPAELKPLAHEFATWYEHSLSLLDGLADAYGFQYAAFWQPSLFFENRRVGDEEQLPGIVWRLSDQNQAAFYKLVREEIRRIGNPHFHDFVDVLRDRSEQTYLDDVHVSEQGNAFLAEKIIETIRGGLPPPRSRATVAQEQRF